MFTDVSLDWDSLEVQWELVRRRQSELDKREANLTDDYVRVMHLREAWEIEKERQVGLLKAGKLADLGLDVLRDGGLVYFVLCHGSTRDGQVKIGKSKKLHQRLAQHRKEYSPASLELLAVEPGYTSLERQRHLEFSHFRDGNTEWFTFGESLQALVRAIRTEFSQLFELAQNGLF